MGASGTVATVGVVTTVASGTGVTVVTALQVWAIFSLLSCQIDGEQSSTTRRLLAPLRFTSYDSADLMGSLALVVGVSAVYLTIANIVFATVRLCTDRATSPAEDGVAESPSEQALDQRMQRAKLFLLYPQVPVLVMTMLFTGITFDSCRLLFGTLQHTAETWERVLGGVCLGAAVMFVAYYVWAGMRAHALLTPSSANSDIKPPPTDTALSGAVGDLEQPAPFSRSSSRASSSTSATQRRAALHVVSPSKPMPADMVAVVDATDLPSEDVGSTRLEAVSEMSDQTPARPCRVHSPAAVGTPAMRALVPCNDMSGPLDDESVEGPARDAYPLQLTQFDHPTEEAHALCKPSSSADAQKERPRTDAAVVWEPFNEDDTRHYSWVITRLLAPSGRWGNEVRRSLLCVVTPMKPEYVGCRAMTSNSLVRAGCACIIAAVEASSQTTCDVVHSLVSVVCFAHGILLLVLRPYRVPVLNMLNALQSVLLGLLACTQFMGSATAQTALSIVFIAACFATVSASAGASFLEFLINRRRQSNVEQALL